MSRSAPGAWAGYWNQAGGARRGCLPDSGSALDRTLDAVWSDFARVLPAGARVLDLATGDGVVLRRLAASGRRLHLTGIDSAPRLPPAPSGIRLKAGIGMENLPFADRSFDAVTSQFGIEYGDPGRIAPEVGRMLKPSGRARFVIHDRGSVILSHNLARRSALLWAALESDLLGRAEKLARARLATQLPTPASFRAAVADARARFPGQTVAAEFAAGVLQALELANPREMLARLGHLREQAEGEIARLDALERAARNEAEARKIADALEASGLTVASLKALTEIGTDERLAWILDSTRPA